jgi:hypothetical protein
VPPTERWKEPTVTQVARGVGPSAASRPGIAIPIRIHDLLLSLAGRLDDDALADARQMLASAELDRSLEFLAGCLAAGRVVLTHEQHAELAALFADTYLDPSVIDRVMVTDRLNIGRHRFAIGSVDGREPERGVADAVRSVLGVLPDVRSMWCVWRLTPAGPASGPVPHLLVLVGIGPGGFAPATTYRVEDALRRAGIRASVEVLMDGIEPDEYHREAMRSARQVPFDGPGFNRPRVEPAYEATRIAPARVERVEAPRMTAPPELPRLEPARVQPEPPRVSAVQAEPARIIEAPRAAAVEPPRAEPPRMSVVPDLPRVEPPPVDAPRIDSEVPLRKAPSFSDAPEQSRIDGPTMMAPATGGLVGPGGLVGAEQEQEPELPRVEAVRNDPVVPEPSVRAIEPQFEQERPAEPAAEPQAVLREESRTESAPSPSPRRRPEPEDPPSRPHLAPANSVDKHSQAFVDDILNTQERNLLKELQDELARREQEDAPPSSGNSGSWRVDRSGRHGKPATAGPFDHPNQTTGPMIINGVPPYGGDRHPPAN